MPELANVLKVPQLPQAAVNPVPGAQLKLKVLVVELMVAVITAELAVMHPPEPTVALVALTQIDI